MTAWKGYVYCLRDPATGLVRYVGMTDDLARRKGEHFDIKDRRNAAKRRWVLTLKLAGTEPIFQVLEECELYQMRAKERYWIDFYKRQGNTLFNYERRTIEPRS